MPIMFDQIEENLTNDSKSYETSIALKRLETLTQFKVHSYSNGFCEIAGYDNIKRQLKTIVILPQRQPQLFQRGQRLSSVLLYGPPGTGKTCLAKSLASEADADFYHITPSSFLSSYFGQTEREINNFFTALHLVEKPSIIFFDEVDGLCRTRSNSESDTTRRVKSELLTCLSTLDEGNHNAFVLCATNCPWDLDTAFLRRFQKRIYVPLPSPLERYNIFRLHARLYGIDDPDRFDWDMLSTNTANYSCSDLKNMFRCALAKPLAELYNVKVWSCVDDKYYVPLQETCNDALFRHKIHVSSVDELPAGTVQARGVEMRDFTDALKDVKATIDEDQIRRYNEYEKLV